ncbi:hypothetical protein A2994_02400 [candidate division Kazan bacterium RIFCSPLOWO2_01_FULL_48_13]|uniref:Nudix hydrolase domain-containing protein n=1 Tax=candidate division Kazan bacterium RIFCSPLOWO2_01_FULL_48_13 TaxID=1798539 RepID=A0A1F4PPC2_UNCK3|nr:MAG: hypothetical protein A2994_02400 [candidate division Kazan bacterium RIFCSPLOWO2_01_FULL_48_13]
MSEIVTTYMLNNPGVDIPMDRGEFYAEQIKAFKETGEPTRAVGIIAILMFDEKGEIYLQKRSDTKFHNAGLMDKSIGGHIQYGDSDDYSVMVETVQELQVPSIVLRTDEDFRKTHQLLRSHLSTIALVKQVGVRIFNSEKVINGEKVVIANKVHLFFGLYGGAIKTVDREAKGVLLYTLDALARELSANPDQFTYDIHVLFRDYREKMESFIKADLAV